MELLIDIAIWSTVAAGAGVVLIRAWLGRRGARAARSDGRRIRRPEGGGGFGSTRGRCRRRRDSRPHATPPGTPFMTRTRKHCFPGVRACASASVGMRGSSRRLSWRLQAVAFCLVRGVRLRITEVRYCPLFLSIPSGRGARLGTRVGSEARGRLRSRVIASAHRAAAWARPVATCESKRASCAGGARLPLWHPVRRRPGSLRYPQPSHGEISFQEHGESKSQRLPVAQSLAVSDARTRARSPQAQTRSGSIAGICRHPTQGAARIAGTDAECANA